MAVMFVAMGARSRASTRVPFGTRVGLTAEAVGKRLADLTHYGWGRTTTFQK